MCIGVWNVTFTFQKHTCTIQEFRVWNSAFGLGGTAKVPGLQIPTASAGVVHMGRLCNASGDQALHQILKGLGQMLPRNVSGQPSYLG